MSWISVKKELPEKGRDCYLGELGSNSISEGQLATDYQRESLEEVHEKKFGEQLWDNCNWFGPIEGKFTHWQYKVIPEPPTEE